jgi:hypothetical protein
MRGAFVHANRSVSRKVLSLVALAALAVLTQVSPAIALQDPAWLSRHSEAEQQAIVDWAYDGGPQGATPYPDAASQGTELWQTELRATGTSAAEDMAKYSFRTRVAAKLLPAFAEVVPQIDLATVSFAAGWKVGTTLNAKFIHIGIPAQIPYTGYSGGQKLSKVSAGDFMFGVTIPDKGYVFSYDNGRTNFFLDLALQNPSCDPYGVLQTPSGYSWMPGWVTDCSIGVPPGGQPFHGHIGVFFKPDTDFSPTTPGTTFDPTTDSPTYSSSAPATPDTSTARDAIGQALGADAAQVVRDELDWALTPSHQDKEEPVKIGLDTEPDTRCKSAYGDAPNPDPDPDSTLHPSDEIRQTYLTSVGSANLVWGTRERGERHIILRHGFGADAQARTRGALETDSSPTPDPRGGYDFHLPLDPVEGTRCRQTVVLSASPQFGVITSFIEAY